MSAEDEDEVPQQFGSTTPFAEPPWYNSKNATPYYTEHHARWRDKMRAFVEEEIIPFCDDWEEAGEIPSEVRAMSERERGREGERERETMLLNILRWFDAWLSLPCFLCDLVWEEDNENEI